MKLIYGLGPVCCPDVCSCVSRPPPAHRRLPRLAFGFHAADLIALNGPIWRAWAHTGSHLDAIGHNGTYQTMAETTYWSPTVQTMVTCIVIKLGSEELHVFAHGPLGLARDSFGL